MATVRKVIGKGGPVGTSTVADGVPLALKLWNEGGDDGSLEQFHAESRTLFELSTRRGDIPCPRLYDLVGSPVVTGMIMEWCPVDLERWWGEKLAEPEAFGRLMATLAESARRLDDYHRFTEKNGNPGAHGDLKSSNILLDIRGRWLISDFGHARIAPPEDNPLITGVIAGGTQSFLAPEVLFHARQPFPAAIDTWGLAAVAYSLVALRRVVLEGTSAPRNGSHAPRFRMHRMDQVLALFDKAPTRFKGKHLAPAAFPDPLTLPEADRTAIAEALRGVFGAEDPDREAALTEAFALVIERATSIDPSHRYTSANDLAVAFEEVATQFISLASARVEAGMATKPAEPGDDGKAVQLESQLEELKREVERLRDSAKEVEEVEATGAPDSGGQSWLMALVIVLVIGGMAALGAVMLVMGIGLALFAL